MAGSPSVAEERVWLAAEGVKVLVGVVSGGDVMMPNMGWESNSRVAWRDSTGGVGRSVGDLDEPVREK